MFKRLIEWKRFGAYRGRGSKSFRPPGTGCREQIRELVTINVTMIALASFIVEPDYTLPVLTVKQSVLEQMGAAGNWLRHLPNNDLDDRSVGQHSLGTFDKDRCNQLIMPLSRSVGKKANAIPANECLMRRGGVAGELIHSSHRLLPAVYA